MVLKDSEDRTLQQLCQQLSSHFLAEYFSIEAEYWNF